MATIANTITDIIFNKKEFSNNSTGGRKGILHAVMGQKFNPNLSAKVGGGVITREETDGTIRIAREQANVHSIPPDGRAFINNNLLQLSKKSKAKKHALNEMYRRQGKRERPVEKEETMEEQNARFEALVELVGLEEAKEIMNRDFWA
jgi:hypothetical protein